MSEDKCLCPHCGQKMSKFRSPAESSWGGGEWVVCFNNECGYFVRGWEHMSKTRGVKCSYRHRLNPETGECGPMPVYSASMGLDCIIEEGPEE